MANPLSAGTATVVNNATATASVVLTRPSAALVGDLLVAHINTAGATITTPTGWTLITMQVAVTTARMYVFQKRYVTGDATTYTFPLSVSNVNSAGMTAWYQTQGLIATDLTTGNKTVAATSWNVSRNSTQPEKITCVFFGLNAGTTAQVTTPTGWTSLYKASTSGKPAEFFHLNQPTFGPSVIGTTFTVVSNTGNAVVVSLSGDGVLPARTDTPRLSVTDTSDDSSTISRTDIETLTLDDQALVEKVDDPPVGGDTPVPAADDLTLSVTDSAVVQVTIAVSDTSTLAAIDTRTGQASLTRPDTATTSVTDTSSNSSTLSRTDPGTISVVDTRTLAVQVTPSDALGLILSDSVNTSVSLDGSDILGLSVADSSLVDKQDVVVTIEKNTFDTPAISVTDTAVVAITAHKTGSDTATLSVTETAGISTEVSRTDTLELSVTDLATTTVYVNVSDDAVILVTETAEAVEPYMEFNLNDGLTLVVNDQLVLINQFQQVEIIVGRKQVDTLNGAKTPDAYVSRKIADVGNPSKSSDVIVGTKLTTATADGGN